MMLDVNSEIVRFILKSHTIFGKGISLNNLECSIDIPVENGNKLIYFDSNIDFRIQHMIAK